MKKEIKSVMKQVDLKLYSKRLERRYDNFYNEVCKKNTINAKKTVEGEKEWMEYWGDLCIHPNPMYYRLFSRYVGKNKMIVPEDICRYAIENVLNPPRFIKTYIDKNVWGMLFSDKIMPPTILRCIDGFYYDKDYTRINLCDTKKLTNIFRLSGFKYFVVKPTRDSNSSHGVFTIKYEKTDYFVNKNGAKHRCTIELLREIEGKNWIIQPFMEQHPDIQRFCTTSVNPIRINTYRSVKDDKVHVLKGGVLRVGFQGETNDGTHGNGKFIGINPDGSLMHEVLDFYGTVTTSFNGIDFRETYKIPNFEGICELAKNVATKVLHHRLLAFDIMLDKNGNPVMLEYNIEAFSMWLPQFVGVAAFGEFTDEIIEYVRNHLNEIEHYFY